VRATPGTLVAAPAGVVHTFANETSDEATFLNIHAPSMGFGEMLRARRDGRDEDTERFDQFDPPPDGGRPVSDAVVRGPGEGDDLALGPSRALFKAEGSDGDGTFCLVETTLAAGFPGPVLHRHRELVDTFFVLDGTLALRLGDDEVEAPPGSFACIPPGNVHTFANRSRGTVRIVNLMAPGGFEQYLKEVARVTTTGTPDPQLMAEIASRYDFEPVT
jgi:mannose-6-phosphate isomerase-like protein (cupin superfamily)